MNSKLTGVLHSPQTFLSTILAELKANQIDISNLEIDHICYRVETTQRYKELKVKLATISTPLSENIINGRAISVFKLSNPIIIEKFKIWCLELPSPKIATPYKEGWEHIEIVINSTLKKFVDNHTHVMFNTKNSNDTRNPDISIQLNSGVVKFHTIHIGELIAKEQEEKL
ncbi:MAG: VOC family protein [Candidatus Nanoarchaeia archaeon]